MDRVFLGKIHKIILGTNPGNRDSMGYSCGSRVDSAHPNVVVSSIEMDDSLYEKFGKTACIVWAKDTANPNNIAFPFRSFIDVPLTLCSDLESLN